MLSHVIYTSVNEVLTPNLEASHKLVVILIYPVVTEGSSYQNLTSASTHRILWSFSYQLTLSTSSCLSTHSLLAPSQANKQNHPLSIPLPCIDIALFHCFSALQNFLKMFCFVLALTPLNIILFKPTPVRFWVFILCIKTTRVKVPSDLLMAQPNSQFSDVPLASLSSKFDQVKLSLFLCTLSSLGFWDTKLFCLSSLLIGGFLVCCCISSSFWSLSIEDPQGSALCLFYSFGDLVNLMTLRCIRYL